LVRLFPLSFYWQIIATGIMGVVVMALIPQQTAPHGHHQPDAD
jgi:hypothetical protein